ncbi:MAG: M48 family metallopeptidase [Pseudomonadota bacterium]
MAGETSASLETQGRYFDGESARAKEVIVGLGQRSIVIFGHGDVAIAHWPLGALRASRGGGIGELTLMPGFDSGEQLIIDDPEMIRIVKKVCPRLYRSPGRNKGVRRAVVWGGLAVGSVATIVFVIMPAMADRLAPMVPFERARALGDASVQQQAAFLARSSRFEDGLCDGPKGRAALDKMTARLMPHADLPYPTRVDVLDSEIVNATASGGGRVLLYRGLIDKSKSPEEVAGVLAHEMGHEVHHHVMTGVLRRAGTTGVLAIVLGDFFGGGAAAGLGELMIETSYTREHEREADDQAIAIMTAAGLPTTPFAGFFARMEDEYGSTPAALELISSHPQPGDRAEKARAANTVGSQYDPILTDAEWVALQNICIETF